MPTNPIATRGADHRGIAEHRLAREDRDDLGREAEAGQHQHVHLGVAEDPEEVLPQHRRASGLRVEEVRAEIAVEHQHDLRGRQRSEDDEHHAGRDQVEPDDQRHAAERHAGTAHAQDGRDDVDRRADAAESGDEQRDRPVVGAVALRERLRGEWRVGEPAHIGRAARARQPFAAQEAEIQQEPAERARPEAEGVESRKRHVAGADHQGHEVVRKPEHDRDADEEDHRRAVHREETIEHLRRDDGEVRIRQLDPHDRGFEAADREKDDGVDHIHQPEALVIDRDDPLVQAVEQRRRGGSCTGQGRRVEHASSLRLDAHRSVTR